MMQILKSIAMNKLFFAKSSSVIPAGIPGEGKTESHEH